MIPNGTLPVPLTSGPEGPLKSAFLIRIAQSHRPCDLVPIIYNLGASRSFVFSRGDVDSEQTAADGAQEILVDDRWMSFPHARISGESGRQTGFVIEDLGSRNGTRVNGETLIAPTPLADGDVIEMGHSFWLIGHRSVAQRDEIERHLYRGGVVNDASTLNFEVATLYHRVERIASSQIPVMIFGESGTGKEVLARYIHECSGRKGPYVALNCAAIPEGLIESELFGHRRGAFTGAHTDKVGVIESAQEGTLLLDEIGDMPAAAQAKLLRVLQERTVVRVGETKERKIAVRFIAATHRDVKTMVSGESFRGDLYARLNGCMLRLPALKERREDIGLLAARFIAEANGGESAPEQISAGFYRALFQYSWPFNIRELQQVINISQTMAGRSAPLNSGHLPVELIESLSQGGGLTDSHEPVGRSEEPADLLSGHDVTPIEPRRAPKEPLARRVALTDALKLHRGNVSHIARHFKTTRSQIHRWLKRFDIDPEQYRG